MRIYSAGWAPARLLEILECQTDVVVIRSSPSLAFYTIFIILSSEVVDLHICICIRTSHCLCLAVCICCAPQLRSLSRLPTQFLTWFHLFATV